jgi:hypothetical protein
VPKELDEGSVIQSNPKGVAFVPPGLELAKFFLEKLRKGKNGLTVETLKQDLPPLLTSDLEIMEQFEIEVDDGVVVTKSTNSLYKDFCNDIRIKTRVCQAFGCPICSAVACLLVYATGQPVRLEGDESVPQLGRVTTTTYRILPAPLQNVQSFSDLRSVRVSKTVKAGP